MTQAIAPQLSEAITLDDPLKRGETTIDSVQIRKPNSGELRGLNLVDVSQLGVDSLIKLLPRVTVPALTAQEVASLAPADLLALGAEVASFLLTKRQKLAAFQA